MAATCRAAKQAAAQRRLRSEHAQEDAVVELAEGAGEGGEQGGHRSGQAFGSRSGKGLGAGGAPQKPRCNTAWHGVLSTPAPRANAWPGRLSNRTRPIGRRNSLSFNAGPAQTDHTDRYGAHLVIVCLDDRIECRRIDQTFSISKDSSSLTRSATRSAPRRGGHGDGQVGPRVPRSPRYVGTSIQAMSPLRSLSQMLRTTFLLGACQRLRFKGETASTVARLRDAVRPGEAPGMTWSGKR